MIARRLSRALPVVAGLVLAAGWFAPAPFGAALNGVALAQDKDKPAVQPPKPALKPPVFLDPIPAKEALTKFKLPEGFKISLFAAEPDVVQPIAFTIDDRGRLWVVENLSYPTWKETGSDRISIFEDTNNDGTFDKKKVFWDKGRYATGVLLGFGGVFVCDAPDLLFIPDKNGDDVPDGPPEVLLTGWSTKGKHNVLNALKWGPDGWLYGCNGITAPSKVGTPGTPEDKRVEINCGVWRWHPTKKIFDVVAHGTTNPWGLDFDEYGQMFITNCVIKHLFHVVPGGHYERMFGNDVNPYSYGLMQGCADHIHWAEGTKWTDSRGGKGAADPGLTLLASWTVALRARPAEEKTMSGSDLARDLDLALSRQALHELLTAYCRGVDRADAALLASCFHDDAVVVTGTLNGPAREFVPGMTALLRQNVKRVFHSVSNEWFQIAGDRAVGESYAIAVGTVSENGTDVDSLVGGRYLDRFERRAGVWKIAERVFVQDWNMRQPSTAAFDEAFYAGLKLRGCYGPSDPVYAFWRE